MIKIGWPLQRNAQFWWRQFPTSSWIHMLELIKSALRFGQKPPSTQHIVSVIFVENTSYVHLTRFWYAGMKSERSKHVMSCQFESWSGHSGPANRSVFSCIITAHSIQSFAHHVYNQFDSNEIYFEHPVDNQVCLRTLYSKPSANVEHMWNQQ
jgi:hypothetical protein